MLCLKTKKSIIYSKNKVKKKGTKKYSSELPPEESGFLVSTDMGRSENRWKGCKTEGAERLSNVY